MADRRRNRPDNRDDKRPRATGAPGDAAGDDETAAALALFNARLAQQAESERTQRRIDKAQREKDAAAARVRALENDSKATAAQRTEATEAYKAALARLERTKRGEPEPAPEDATPDAAEPTPT